MKSIIFNKYGISSVLAEANLPMPKLDLNSDNVLIEIRACSLNPIDFKLRSGCMKDMMTIMFPFTPGCDISGIIKEVGSNVPDITNFKIGDEVYFSSELTKGGGYAEYCVVNCALVSHKPKLINYIQAASLPIVGLTSIQALKNYANIKPNHKILIHAGAGGVGSFAIQYAKYMGAIVYTTASKSNHEYLYKLGADCCIDYTCEDFVGICKNAGGMDIVFETIGGQNYIKSISAVKSNGTVPCIVNPPDSDVIALSKNKNIKTDFVLVSNNQKDLQYIATMIDKTYIKPTVEQVIDFDLEEIRQAHCLLESGHARGKIVIKIK